MRLFEFLCTLTVVTIGFSQTEYGPVVEGTDNVATVYVAVLEGNLQRNVSVTFSTASGTATGEWCHFPRRSFVVSYNIVSMWLINPANYAYKNYVSVCLTIDEKNKTTIAL